MEGGAEFIFGNEGFIFLLRIRVWGVSISCLNIFFFFSFLLISEEGQDEIG